MIAQDLRQYLRTRWLVGLTLAGWCLVCLPSLMWAFANTSQTMAGPTWQAVGFQEEEEEEEPRPAKTPTPPAGGEEEEEEVPAKTPTPPAGGEEEEEEVRPGMKKPPAGGEEEEEEPRTGTKPPIKPTPTDPKTEPPKTTPKPAGPKIDPGFPTQGPGQLNAFPGGPLKLWGEEDIYVKLDRNGGKPSIDIKPPKERLKPPFDPRREYEFLSKATGKPYPFKGDAIKGFRWFHTIKNNEIQDLLNKEPIDAVEKAKIHREVHDNLVRLLNYLDTLEAKSQGDAQTKAMAKTSRHRLTEMRDWFAQQSAKKGKPDEVFQWMFALRAADNSNVRAQEYFETFYRDKHSQLLTAGQYDPAREVVRRLTSLYEESTVPAELEQQTKQKAQEVMAQAKKAFETDQLSKAEHLAREAKTIWPELPGLSQFLNQSGLLDSIVVGYPRLPESFVPGTAMTPAERHAQGLIFQPLVSSYFDEKLGPIYTPQLNTGLPKVDPRGRLIHLNSNAVWSDGQAVTLDDVRRTVDLYRQGVRLGPNKPHGFRYLETVKARSSHQGTVVFNRHYWEPTSILTFPIIPGHLFRPGDRLGRENAFNKNPVGSGLFSYADRTSEQMVFKARASAKGPKPAVKQIVFRQFDDTTPDIWLDRLREGRLQMVVDPSPSVAKILEPHTKTHLIDTQSITLLAVNNADPRLADRNLRLALMHAIPRNEMLSNLYGLDERDAKDQIISGPFPAGSWALNRQSSRLTGNPYRAEDVPGFLQARQAAGAVTLTLLYPSENPTAAGACQAIQKALGKHSINIKLEEATPDQMYQRVVVDGNYHLAYWTHHYQDRTFALGPLLNPTDNFLRFENQALATAMDEILRRRQFSHVKKATAVVHEICYQQAPFIPLWTMPTKVLVAENVKIGQIDPYKLFGKPGKWRRLDDTTVPAISKR